jgi:hypothetical protein
MENYISPLVPFFVNMREIFINWFLVFMKFMKNLFITKNYTIKRITLEYSKAPDFNKPKGDWWHFFWTRNMSKCPCDIGWYYSQGFLPDICRDAPDGISNFVIRVKYVYNDQEYTYFTRNPKFSWPPKKVPGFNPKITSAMTREGDFTDIVVSYAGPFNDFHGETMKLYDIYIMRDLILNNKFVIKKDIEFNRETMWSTTVTRDDL